MTYCYELTSGCCGGSVRSIVCIGLWHYMIFGLFIVCFVFTNICFPPFDFPDYFFGGSGGGLLLISFLTACTVDLKKFQYIRGFMALLTVLAVLSTIVSCYYYTILRWNDIIVTLFTHTFRPTVLQDFPDYFWYTLVVIACINSPILLSYIIYITSFMCNKWKSHLFTAPYMNDLRFSSLPPVITIPRETYSTRAYKPYPTQST